jgi:transposase
MRFVDSGNELDFWTKLLALPGLEVVHCEADVGGRMLRFTVVQERRVGVCPHCGAVSDDVRQQRTRERIRDLPISMQAVELEVRVPQLWCAACARPFTPPLPALAEGAHATERFLERAAALIRQSDVVHAAAFCGVPEKTLEGWYYAYVERRQKAAATPPLPIRSLGIDELSLKKSTGNSSPS